MLSLLLGCTLGLQDGTSEGDWASIPEEDEGWGWTVESDLTGRTYSIAPEHLPLVEPEGLGPFLEEALTTRVLVHVDRQDGDSLDLSVTMAAADGRQDPCQPIVAIPSASWMNPYFEAGPTVMTTTFGGHPATLSDLFFSGVFDRWGVGWTEGTLVATLDGREVDAALPEGLTTCGLLEDLGSACIPCADGEPFCVTLVFEGVVADLVDLEWQRDPVCG